MSNYTFKIYERVCRGNYVELCTVHHLKALKTIAESINENKDSFFVKAFENNVECDDLPQPISDFREIKI